MSPNRIHMPSWEEWSGLEDEVQKYHLYKVLETVDLKLSSCDVSCLDRMEKCNIRFTKIEKSKWWNRAVSAIGGIVGGVLAIIGAWAFFQDFVAR